MSDAQAIANEMSTQAKFSLIERLQGRNMPEEDVTIYLDEKLGWELLRLRQRAADAATPEEGVELEKQIAEVKRKLNESAYVFTLRGISNERYDELLDQVNEQFPVEYQESTNALTGIKTRVEVQNDEREDAFGTIFLAATIVKVTDPDGNVDDNIGDAEVTFIKKLAPLDAIRRLSLLAGEMRLAVQWMDEVQDEDFSPRP